MRRTTLIISLLSAGDLAHGRHGPAFLSSGARFGLSSLTKTRRMGRHVPPRALVPAAAAASLAQLGGELLLAADDAASTLSSAADMTLEVPASATPLGAFGGSYWSLYATLGLYLLSFPGLYSTIKRSVGYKSIEKTYVFPGPAAPTGPEGDAGGLELRQIAGEVMGYMQAKNFAVDSAGDVIVFKGVQERSKSQAFFLTFCTAIGLGTLALVLQIQFPAIGGLWYLMCLGSPYAGVYYWSNAATDTQVSMKLLTTDDETQHEMVVQASKEDHESMSIQMSLREKGMVRVKGIFEGEGV